VSLSKRRHVDEAGRVIGNSTSHGGQETRCACVIKITWAFFFEEEGTSGTTGGRDDDRDRGIVRCDCRGLRSLSGHIDLSSIKKSFENCKSAVLAVKRSAGDNAQSRRTPLVGGFLSAWLTRWIVFLLSFRPSCLSPPRGSEGWRNGHGKRRMGEEK